MENIKRRVQLEMALVQVVEEADNGIEKLVGAFSSITTEKQLETLINSFLKDSGRVIRTDTYGNLFFGDK